MLRVAVISIVLLCYFSCKRLIKLAVSSLHKCTERDLRIPKEEGWPGVWRLRRSFFNLSAQNSVLSSPLVLFLFLKAYSFHSMIFSSRVPTIYFILIIKSNCTIQYTVFCLSVLQCANVSITSSNAKF